MVSKRGLGEEKAELFGPGTLWVPATESALIGKDVNLALKPLPGSSQSRIAQDQ